MLLGFAIAPVDQAIIAGYVAIVLAWGLWLGRSQKNTEDYFLGGRKLPGWAILLSIVATETSTVTFLSIPGKTYDEGGDFRFLQITFGYIVGRMLVVVVLLPLFFRGQLFTSYEVLQNRFGTTTRRGASLLFLVTRNLSDALRLFLTALALQQATELDLSTCVIGLGIVTIIYTLVGGAKAVIWNDCLQFAIYMLGAVCALAVISSKLPDGFGEIVEFGQDTGRFQLIDFRLSYKAPMTFWAGLVGGMFLTAATHGTDQMLVQRYLSSTSQKSAGWAVVLSGFIVCAQFALFLLIGVALACFYNSLPTEKGISQLASDQVFAHFIVNYLGVGLVGLVLAAVFAAAMSTLSSSLNSSATAFINDIYLPLSKSELSAEQQLRMSRIATLVFGIVQICIALASDSFGFEASIVVRVLGIMAFALGPMLGLYLIGVFTKRVGELAALAGFIAGIAVLSTVALATPLDWPWYSAVGALSVAAFSLLFHFLRFDSPPNESS